MISSRDVLDKGAIGIASVKIANVSPVLVPLLLLLATHVVINLVQ